jgi:hypothetical protein
MPGGSGTFRFLCPSTNCVLFSRTEKEPEVDGFELNPDQTPDYEDQHFRFLPEETVDLEIEYDMKSARIVREEPTVIATQDLENSVEVQQDQTLIWNEDVTEEHSFEHSHGREVGGEVGLKIHLVPTLIETDVRLKATVKNEWKTGQKNVETVKIGVNAHLIVPAGKTFTAELTVTKGTITVPVRVFNSDLQRTITDLVLQQQYTIKSTGKDSGAKNEVKGVYTGVQFYKIHSVVYDVENPDKRRSIPHKVNVNKETRSYEPQDESQEPEKTEAYGNEEYDEPHSLEDDPQEEEYPGVEQGYQNGYSADDAETVSESQQHADGESHSVEEQQEDYPETGEVEREDYPETEEVEQEEYPETEEAGQEDYPENGEAEQDEQTQSYGTDARREFAYNRQNEDDQEPRLEQAFDDNCDEDNETQRYGNSRNAADQQALYVEPVDGSRDADDQQIPASYCGDDDAEAAMAQRYQSKEYGEEPPYDSGYQSRAVENEVSDEQSYIYDERNGDGYQQSVSYK